MLYQRCMLDKNHAKFLIWQISIFSSLIWLYVKNKYCSVLCFEVKSILLNKEASDVSELATNTVFKHRSYNAHRLPYKPQLLQDFVSSKRNSDVILLLWITAFQNQM